MRHGKQNRLPAIRWVGDDFLVAGHAGVKDQFKNCFSSCAESRPGINRAVLQHKDGCVLVHVVPLVLVIASVMVDWRSRIETQREILITVSKISRHKAARNDKLFLGDIKKRPPAEPSARGQSRLDKWLCRHWAQVYHGGVICQGNFSSQTKRGYEPSTRSMVAISPR